MRTILLLICMVAIGNVHAQQQTLAPDQNPNYMISQQKYMQVKDSLSLTMNTTEQDTYKAYDWYEAKLERRQNRISTRQQIRINRSLNNNFWNNGWNDNYWNNGWNNNGWNNGWNRNRWNNSRFFPGSIGYRTGNWWFWF